MVATGVEWSAAIWRRPIDSITAQGFAPFLLGNGEKTSTIKSRTLK